MREKIYNSIDGLAALEDLYSRIEKESTLFTECVGLACPGDCGQCCMTPSYNIEASVFEMLLPAIELWRQGRALELLKQLEASPHDSVCVLFAPGVLPRRRSLHLL